MDTSKLEEINLRLKQLVALQALENMAENYYFPYDMTMSYYEEGDPKAKETERIFMDEAREQYQDEFLEATEALKQLEEKQDG